MAQNCSEITVVPKPYLFSTFIWLFGLFILFLIPVLVWGFKGNEASFGVCTLFILSSSIYYLASEFEYRKMKRLEFSFETEKLNIGGKTFDKAEISLIHISKDEKSIGFIIDNTSYILNLNYFDKPKEILEYFKLNS